MLEAASHPLWGCVKVCQDRKLLQAVDSLLTAVWLQDNAFWALTLTRKP